MNNFSNKFENVDEMRKCLEKYNLKKERQN